VPRDRNSSFCDFFEKATGRTPSGEVTRLASGALPDTWTVPRAGGKTEVILPWLWRHRAEDPRRSRTPRRLVYLLPQRAEPEQAQAASDARTWLANLGLTEEVALHVPLAEWSASHGDWRQDMHRPAIIIGTADILLSRALIRGFGTSRVIAPIDFALLTNGAHWIIASPERCPVTAVTLREVAALATTFGTAEPFGYTQIFTERPGPFPAPSSSAPALHGATLIDLFDTAPSPEREVDIVPYAMDEADLDAEVAWATWTPAPDGAPSPEISLPPAEYRHRVPLSQIPELAAGRPVWRWHRESDSYTRVDTPGQPPVRPYELLLVRAMDGPYLLTADEAAEAVPEEQPPPGEPREWQSLDQHSEQVRDQAEALLQVLTPDIPGDAARSVVLCVPPPGTP
jgi:CRISPR-associated endonuclease/helicase Cas3